jgi:hypothetical protein
MRIARLGRNVTCIAFTASVALVGVMVARGVQVRRHPLHPQQLVAPAAQISNIQFWELLGRKDFIFVSLLTLLVSPTGSNQTFTSPGTWNSANNKIECIGAGAGGGGSSASDTPWPGGGGGGGYSAITNFSFAAPGTTTATYQIGSGGAGGIVTTVGLDGGVGGDTWFNATTLAGSSVGAHGGGSLNNGSGSLATPAGGLGGSVTGAQGTTKLAGGAGGAGGSGTGNGGGGGGSAGPSGAGGAGVVGPTSTGGSADNGTVAGGAKGSNGNSGTEFDGTHGCGSGGGGGANAAAGKTGGLYGGGGGGGSTSTVDVNGGAGAQGIVVLTWTPLAYAFGRRRIVVFTR